MNNCTGAKYWIDSHASERFKKTQSDGGRDEERGYDGIPRVEIS
jgi:hypothetical protein